MRCSVPSVQFHIQEVSSRQLHFLVLSAVARWIDLFRSDFHSYLSGSVLISLFVDLFPLWRIRFFSPYACFVTLHLASVFPLLLPSLLCASFCLKAFCSLPLSRSLSPSVLRVGLQVGSPLSIFDGFFWRLLQFWGFLLVPFTLVGIGLRGPLARPGLFLLDGKSPRRQFPFCTNFLGYSFSCIVDPAIQKVTHLWRILAIY